MAALTAACVALVLSATAAQAAITHPYIGSFGPASGSFGQVAGIAVEQSTQDVYVYDDSEGGQIYKFNANGEPVDFSGLGGNVIESVGQAGSAEEQLAVDDSAGPAKGDIYAANNREVIIYSAAGAKLGTLTGGEMCGVAVDSAGHVYVGIYPSSVAQYVPTANPVTNEDYVSSLSQMAGVCNVAVDGTGNAYAVSWGGGVHKYAPSQFNTNNEPAVSIPSETAFDTGGRTAVDDLSGSLYVGEQSGVSEYTDAGIPQLVGRFAAAGPGALSSVLGVAVDTTTGQTGSGDIYAGGASSGKVNIYGPEILVPDVSVEPASEVETTSAALSGTVNPDGHAVTGCRFEYGTEPGVLTQTAACTPAPGSGNSPVAVSAKPSGLMSGVSYFFRLVATNANGSNYSEELSFQTPASVDGVGNEEATEIGKVEATLNGSLSPDGTDAHYYFEYGPAGEYGLVSPALPGTDAGSVSEAVHAQTTLTGLTAGTTYQYRLIAVNARGATYSESRRFTTLPGVDGVTTQPAGEFSQSTATMNGALSPDGVDAHYYFEYGKTEQYGSVIPAPPGTDAGGAYEAVPAQAKLTGLSANTTYHYRLVAVNSLGFARGADRTFTTLPLPPSLTGEPTVSSVTRTTALISPTVDDSDVTSTAVVQFAAEGAYAPGASEPYAAGSSSPSYPLPAVRGAAPVRGMLVAGLLAGTTYHYRVVVTNRGGSSYGADYTFTTAAATPPAVETAPASSVTTTTAELSGVVLAQALQTSYEFEVGTDTSYSGAEIFGNAGQSAAPEAVSANLQFLVPGTTYHYRLIATNVDGTTYGPDMTFVTPGVAAPIAQPPATPLISVPTFQFPNTSGAITKPIAKAKKTKKKKITSKRKKTKRKAQDKRRKQAGGER
jgi:hypothetical protein